MSDNMTTTTRHPLSQRFHAVLDELGALHDKKQQDYGRPTDPFANVRGSQEWAVEPWVGAMLRGNDKIKRLQKYAQTGELANEGVEDSFKDLAVYAIIGLVLWEEERALTQPRPDQSGRLMLTDIPNACACASCRAGEPPR